MKKKHARTALARHGAVVPNRSELYPGSDYVAPDTIENSSQEPHHGYTLFDAREVLKAQFGRAPAGLHVGSSRGSFSCPPTHCLLIEYDKATRIIRQSDPDISKSSRERPGNTYGCLQSCSPSGSAIHMKYQERIRMRQEADSFDPDTVAKRRGAAL